MCTLVLLRRPAAPWPLLLAANRDELRSRAALAPARHWPDRPHIRGGLDVTGGGTWLGLNDDGVVAAVLNRRGTLGPEPGKRSRGELVLEALEHAEATRAADALRALEPSAYRPFNLIVADAVDAFWVGHAGDGAIRVAPVPVGLHMIERASSTTPPRHASPASCRSSASSRPPTRTRATGPPGKRSWPTAAPRATTRATPCAS